MCWGKGGQRERQERESKLMKELTEENHKKRISLIKL